VVVAAPDEDAPDGAGRRDFLRAGDCFAKGRLWRDELACALPLLLVFRVLATPFLAGRTFTEERPFLRPAALAVVDFLALRFFIFAIT
jgi:hypothetical protein